MSPWPLFFSHCNVIIAAGNQAKVDLVAIQHPHPPTLPPSMRFYIYIYPLSLTFSAKSVSGFMLTPHPLKWAPLFLSAVP